MLVVRHVEPVKRKRAEGEAVAALKRPQQSSAHKVSKTTHTSGQGLHTHRHASCARGRTQLAQRPGRRPSVVEAGAHRCGPGKTATEPEGRATEPHTPRQQPRREHSPPPTPNPAFSADGSGGRAGARWAAARGPRRAAGRRSGTRVAAGGAAGGRSAPRPARAAAGRGPARTLRQPPPCSPSCGSVSFRSPVCVWACPLGLVLRLCVSQCVCAESVRSQRRFVQSAARLRVSVSVTDLRARRG